MATGTISEVVREPTTAEVTQFIMTGDFTGVGAGITVHVTLNLLNDSDGSVNRVMNFVVTATAGELNHFAGDVASAMNGIVEDVEAILGITFA